MEYRSTDKVLGLMACVGAKDAKKVMIIMRISIVMIMMKVCVGAKDARKSHEHHDSYYC